MLNEKEWIGILSHCFLFYCFGDKLFVKKSSVEMTVCQFNLRLVQHKVDTVCEYYVNIKTWFRAILQLANLKISIVSSLFSLIVTKFLKMSNFLTSLTRFFLYSKGNTY